ncbi:MAG: hypothetical protein KAI80_09875, partial [Hyphomicrobiaceae bacterium]|nr:hypothetical protein [Hyphomicrobiaceae bacterium]
NWYRFVGQANTSGLARDATGRLRHTRCFDTRRCPLAEAAVPRELFREILPRIAELRLRPTTQRCALVGYLSDIQIDGQGDRAR